MPNRLKHTQESRSMKLTTHNFWSNAFYVIAKSSKWEFALLLYCHWIQQPSTACTKMLHVSALLKDHHQEQKYVIKNKTIVLCMTVEYCLCVSSETFQSRFKFCVAWSGGGSSFSCIFHKLKYGSLLKQCLVAQWSAKSLTSREEAWIYLEQERARHASPQCSRMDLPEKSGLFEKWENWHKRQVDSWSESWGEATVCV